MARTVIRIDRGDHGVRIDRVLFRHLSHIRGISRNRLQRLIDNGSVHVNGCPVSRPAARVATGDFVDVQLPERRARASPTPEKTPLVVLYEDGYLVIVDKPAGQVAHPAFRNATGTLLNALLGHAAGGWAPRLVSRLDKGTSGLVLVAKDSKTHAALQRLGQHNGIHKDYLAVVMGRPPRKGTIDLPLDRDPWDRRRVTVRDRGGVPSVTKFERLQSVAIAPGRYVSLVRCRLVTGRLHQIRVHLAAKGWPIVGDPVYGPGAKVSLSAGVRQDSAPQLGRQALHAWHLAFRHHVTGSTIDLTAALPDDMKQLLETISLTALKKV